MTKLINLQQHHITLQPYSKHTSNDVVVLVIAHHDFIILLYILCCLQVNTFVYIISLVHILQRIRDHYIFNSFHSRKLGLHRKLISPKPMPSGSDCQVLIYFLSSICQTGCLTLSLQTVGNKVTSIYRLSKWSISTHAASIFTYTIGYHLNYWRFQLTLSDHEILVTCTKYGSNLCSSLLENCDCYMPYHNIT